MNTGNTVAPESFKKSLKKKIWSNDNVIRNVKLKKYHCESFCHIRNFVCKCFIWDKCLIFFIMAPDQSTLGKSRRQKNCMYLFKQYS
jgi:hypothetical protein